MYQLFITGGNKYFRGTQHLLSVYELHGSSFPLTYVFTPAVILNKTRRHEDELGNVILIAVSHFTAANSDANMSRFRQDSLGVSQPCVYSTLITVKVLDAEYSSSSHNSSCVL